MMSNRAVEGIIVQRSFLYSQNVIERNVARDLRNGHSDLGILRTVHHRVVPEREQRLLVVVRCNGGLRQARVKQVPQFFDVRSELKEERGGDMDIKSLILRRHF